jgi:type IV pilus assembly protein PilM
VRRFGQVALPFGAVVAGEIVQPDVVASALRRLWREAGFRSRTVVTGVANQRVVARTAEVPSMPDDELRSALQFQVQDLIPIPVEEAILDYQVLERVLGPEGEELLRVIVVAAHREMIASVLAALEGAGLTAQRVDLEPFALIRALYAEELLPPEYDEGPLRTGRGEAIVDVGAGVTNVVVHERGVPRFVRTLLRGGNTVAEAVAAELGVDVDRAEELKRGADALSRDPDEARAGQIVAGQLAPLLDEIRGSLDFYAAQADGGGLRRVVLTGGASRLPDLHERLGAVVGVPVERGRPLATVQVPAGAMGEALVEAEDLLAVPLGLALSGEPVDGELRRVDLLPLEVSRRRAERRQLALAGGGVAVFTALLIALFLLRGGQVNDARSDADQAEARAARLQQQVAGLQDVSGLEQEIAQRRETVTSVLQDDVAWTRLLQEVATVIPNDVWLTSFNGVKGEPGTISVTGMGFDHTSSARWLLRVGELDALTGLWLPSSVVSASGARELVTFSSSASLTEASRSDRAARFLEGPQ